MAQTHSLDLSSIAAMLSAAVGVPVNSEDIQSITIDGNEIDIDEIRKAQEPSREEVEAFVRRIFEPSDVFQTLDFETVPMHDDDADALKDYCEQDVELTRQLSESLDFPDGDDDDYYYDGDVAFDNVLIEGDQVNIIEPVITIENITINVG